jgi:hypothetical protein
MSRQAMDEPGSGLNGGGGELTVEYEELVARYQISLTTTLRGFRGGASCLEGWVPDPRPEQGILNLIEAAGGAGRPAVAVAIGPATLGALSLPTLAAAAGAFGEVTTAAHDGGGAVLRVTFAPRERAAGGATELQERAERVRRAREARESRERARARAADAAPAPGVSFDAVYGEAVRRIVAAPLTHEGALEPAGDAVLVTAAGASAVVEAHVDPACHVVRSARHRGAGSDMWRGLLEGLCRTIEGTPLLDAAYHGVIRLEASLRDRRRPRPVAGIVTPDGAAPEFRALTALARVLLDDYRRRTGYADVDSRWEPEARPAWTALSQPDRLARLQAAVDEAAARHGCGAGDVRCLRLERLTRVTLALPAELAPARKASLLMALEADLKARLEPTLHVYQEEMPDRNKLRRQMGGGLDDPLRTLPQGSVARAEPALGGRDGL